MVITFSRKLYFQKNYYIPYFQLKLQKIIPILDASSNVTKSGQNRFGEHGPLGVNTSCISFRKLDTCENNMKQCVTFMNILLGGFTKRW